MNVRIMPLAVGSLVGLLSLASCSREQKFIGEWRLNNPENVTLNQQGIGTGSAVTTIDFKSGAKSSDGDVVISTVYEISVPDSVGKLVSMTGDCRADGKWEIAVDDDDNLLMSYDYSSIKIDIAGNSVMAMKIRPDVERLFRENMTFYSVVEDMEVNREKTTLSMEVGSPDKKVYFKRVTL